MVLMFWLWAHIIFPFTFIHHVSMLLDHGPLCGGYNTSVKRACVCVCVCVCVLNNVLCVCVCPLLRLVCDSTVEENILKKASQKRMLGNIAIEGGAFTTEFFKQASLHDVDKVLSLWYVRCTHMLYVLWAVVACCMLNLYSHVIFHVSGKYWWALNNLAILLKKSKIKNFDQFAVRRMHYVRNDCVNNYWRNLFDNLRSYFLAKFSCYTVMYLHATLLIPKQHSYIPCCTTFK